MATKTITLTTDDDEEIELENGKKIIGRNRTDNDQQCELSAGHRF